MNNMDFVKQRVTSNIIVDWCEKKAINNLLTFNNSFVSSYQKFRFTTQISEKIIPSTNSKKGYWKNGIFTLYEILNNGGNISVSLLISSKGLTNNKRLNSFLKSTMINYCDEVIVIKTWNIFMLNNKLDNLYDTLDDFFFCELRKYEEELLKWVDDNNYSICKQKSGLVEGSVKKIYTDKYERNQEARQKCIEYHGTKCKICGFDFGEIYESELEGKIEVHHTIPLSKIKQEYVVDPINDLIPVCPNCHMVLHSKEDAYTPDQVKKMINN